MHTHAPANACASTALVALLWMQPNVSTPLALTQSTALHPSRFLARVVAAVEEQARAAAALGAGSSSWRSNGEGGGGSGAAAAPAAHAAGRAGAAAGSHRECDTLRLGRIERSMTMPPLRAVRMLRVLTT